MAFDTSISSLVDTMADTVSLIDDAYKYDVDVRLRLTRVLDCFDNNVHGALRSLQNLFIQLPDDASSRVFAAVFSARKQTHLVLQQLDASSTHGYQYARDAVLRFSDDLPSSNVVVYDSEVNDYKRSRLSYILSQFDDACSFAEQAMSQFTVLDGCMRYAVDTVNETVNQLTSLHSAAANDMIALGLPLHLREAVAATASDLTAIENDVKTHTAAVASKLGEARASLEPFTVEY